MIFNSHPEKINKNRAAVTHKGGSTNPRTGTLTLLATRNSVRLMAILWTAASILCSAEAWSNESAASADKTPIATSRLFQLQSPVDYSFEEGGFQLYERVPDGPRLTLGGNILYRHENWDWFGGPHEDAYDFDFIRTRLQLKAAWSNLEIFIEPQFVQMWNLPDEAVDVGPSGMGGLYYLHNDETSPNGVGFHQAYAKYTFNLPEEVGYLSLQGGRFTYASGLEYFNPADGKKLNTVKKLRLGDRMLSSFEWSAFARSFDGVRADLVATDRFAVTATYMYPTEGGWEQGFNETIHDIRINTLTLTFPKNSLLPGAELGMFAYNYYDSRDCSQRIDNTMPGAPGLCGGADLDIHMFGGHVAGVIPTDNGQWDYLAWGGIQTGEWYELDHSAYAMTAEGGYQWKTAPLKPWLRLGYFLGSGDSNPADGDHETFFQMAPGTRKYQLFPYYDLQNIESTYGQIFLFPHKDITVRLDYSVNRLAQEDDRWYMGTGPTQSEGDIFGYLGRPSNGDNDLSREASLMVKYQPLKYLAFNAFYSHVWGQDVIHSNYPDNEEADYCSIEMSLAF